jgi:hypothetical protein
MRLVNSLGVILLTAVCSAGAAKTADHQWSTGKVLDEDRARYFAGMLNNSTSSTTENGTFEASAHSTSYGDSTNTQIDGSYSGGRNTSTSGSSIPMYRVYDNLVIEGTDTVFVTSERIRWRWSKGAHVAVNGSVQYYVDGRKLHVLDEDNKEHTMEIVKEIKKARQIGGTPPPTPPDNRQTVTPQAVVAPNSQASVEIDSTPSGADIEIDGGFVGNTPSTLSLAPGSHSVSVKKKGFAPWTKTLNVTGGTVHLNAELDPDPPKQ